MQDSWLEYYIHTIKLKINQNKNSTINVIILFTLQLVGIVLAEYIQMKKSVTNNWIYKYSSDNNSL